MSSTSAASCLGVGLGDASGVNVGVEVSVSEHCKKIYIQLEHDLNIFKHAFSPRCADILQPSSPLEGKRLWPLL